MSDARAPRVDPLKDKKIITGIAALVVAAFLGLGVYGKLLTTMPADQVEPIPGEYQAVFEAVVALALLLLHRWGVMWALLALLFSVFTGVTLHRLILGADSCGCFGAIKIPPEITMSADAAIVCMSAWLARAWGLRTWGLSATMGLIPTLVVGGAMYSRHATPRIDDTDFGDVYGDPAPQHTPAIASPTSPEPTPPESTGAPTQDLGAAVETGKITAREALLRLPGVFARGAFDETPAPAWLDDLRKAADPQAELPWLIYVYNRNCDICQAHLPEWNDARQIYEEDLGADKPAVGVLLIEWEDLIPFKIPTYTWGAHTPITLLVRHGKIVRDWRGEAQPQVVDLYLTTQESGLDAALEAAPSSTD